MFNLFGRVYTIFKNILFIYLKEKLTERNSTQLDRIYCFNLEFVIRYEKIILNYDLLVCALLFEVVVLF